MSGAEKKTINQEIGEFINDGRKSSRKLAAERLESLKSAEQLIFNRPGESLLDNFLNEMLEFLSDEDEEIQSFTLLFIVSAVERDSDIVKKVVDSLYNLIQHNSKQSIYIQKRVIITCTSIYPYTLLWTNNKRTDREAEKCWKMFEYLKARIIDMVESPNEGIRTVAIKFTETVIIAQSTKTEFSELIGDRDIVSLGDISRDHRFLSYRKLDHEALQNFNAFMELLSSSTINSQTLLAVVYVVCNIARQRPNYMIQVVSALESLHINLPATLATNQVKSLRKELRFNLLQVLRHPVNFSHHQRLTQLLTDLGCSSSDIQRHMPTPLEVSAALIKRASLASAAAASASVDRNQPSTSAGVVRHADNKNDEPNRKRLKLDDDDYLDEGTAEILRGANDQEDIKNASERAADITANFVYERLSLNVVVKLVTIALFTLPDEMPASFHSTYTDVNSAGSEQQRRHLSRILALQLNREGVGPGIEFLRAEKQKQYLARQNARMDATSSTPLHEVDQNASQKLDRKEPGFLKPVEKPKRGRLIQWDLMKQTKELLPPEAQRLSIMAYQRIVSNEARSVQGGASLAHHQLLVRLATRFHSKTSELFEEQLIEYILADQKNHADLALLWLNELYAQYQGYSTFLTNKGEPDQEFRRMRYEKILTTFSSLLVNRNDIKETLFHRIFLEVPFITPEALAWLRKACLDPMSGGFVMNTLREMILTRTRQRTELLEMFSTLSYHEPIMNKNRPSTAALYDVREECVSVAKELYLIDHIKSELHDFILSMSNQLAMPRPPKFLVVHCQRLTETQANEIEDEELAWDEMLIRAALYLFMSLLPVDHELLYQLAEITGKATNEVKRQIFRIIEPAIKTIGMNSPELLSMIENCPKGAEPLVARIVHLLTERNVPSKELVEKVRNLHRQRNTDVRSLLPIMVGLHHEELLELIPKFVMNATNSKSVPLFYRKLLFGKHIENREYLMDPKELLIQLHHCQPANIREQGHLLQNIDQLIVDSEEQYHLSKEKIASAIEELLNEKELPKFLYHTLQKIIDNLPALRSFLTIVLQSAVQKHPEDQELNDLSTKAAERARNLPAHPTLAY